MTAQHRGAISNHARVLIISRSSEQFRHLDPRVRQGYETRARAEATAARAALEEKRQSLYSQAGLGFARARLEHESDFDLRLSSAPFTSAEMEEFAKLVRSSQFARAKLELRRLSALEPPLEADAAGRSVLAAQRAHGPTGLVTARPPWLAPICLNRESFRDTMLIFQTSEGVRRYYAFVFAVQRPYTLCLAPLRPIDSRFDPVDLSAENFEEVARQHHRWAFLVGFTGFILDCRLPIGEYERAFIVQNLTFQQGGPLISDSEAVGLDDFLACFPADAAPRDDGGSDRSIKQAAHPLAKAIVPFPWLAGVLAAETEETTTTKEASETEEASGEKDKDAELPDEEAAMHDVFLELHMKRAEVLGDMEDRAAFPVKLLGGAWTAMHRGRAFDAFKAEAASKEVVAFCTRFRMPKSARFDISLYGEAGASSLCHGWSRKMAYLYGCFRSHGDDFRFADEHALFDFGGDFEAFVATLVGKAAARVTLVRDLRPINP